jgi:class 3 adenylate cyclase
VSLRQELSLFFGGLLLVVLSLVVGLNYTSLKNTLEAGLKKQFSPQPFLQVAQSERQLLLERARTLVSNQLVNTYRRDALSSLNAAPNRVEALTRARRKDPSLKQLHAELYTLYDQALGVLHGAGSDASNDLVALSADDGTVLLETLGVNYTAFAEVADFDISSKAENLSTAGFWEPILASGDLKGYLVYPDDKLYLFGASWFLKGDYFDGIAMVGTAVDREFLARVSGDNLVFVSYGGKVVGVSEEAQALGQEMSQRTAQSASGEQAWRAANGKTYLVKSEALYSYYPDAAQQQTGEQPLEVGRIAFLRDMAEVEAVAFEQSQRTLILGVGALAVALLLVPLLARRFTGPIGTLSTAMKDVGEGHLEQIPPEKISSIREVREASVSFNQMVIGLRQKKALETFVPEGTRQEVEASGGATPELGGKRVERTILFSDLRGFTSMSERLTPTQVMEVLNLYLECMTRAIRLQGGDINEYIGDAILAVFETPDAAVRAARAMCDELDRLHKEAQIAEMAGLGQGIGIHTGPIVEGNIGEKNARLKRAVIGDTVNLAARIQDRSREGKFTCIFLSGATKAKLTAQVPLEFFGDEQFKGKAELIPVWEVGF